MFIHLRYKSSAAIIFDGYPITGYEMTTWKQFGSPKNKKLLISVLMKRFTAGNMVAKQANEDANRYITTSALDLACTNSSLLYNV